MILIQEHWLSAFDKDVIQDILPKWGNQCICKDEKMEETDFEKRPTPGGSVATLWKESLSPYMNNHTILESSRIAINTLDLPGCPLCIIICYLPSGSSKEATEKFMEDIDRLNELIDRFSPTHEFLVMGDLNEDHFNRRNKKEMAMMQLMTSQHLTDMGLSCKGEVTYDNPHLNHRCHIDHALVKKRLLKAEWSQVKILSQDIAYVSLNTLYHHPVKIDLSAPKLSKSLALAA